MKIATTIAAIAVLAACSPPAAPSCDPFMGTFEIPHGCEKSERTQAAVAMPVLPSAPGRTDPVTPPAADDVTADPVTPSKPRGNASANNGKGGNYDRTGHGDNGRGNGKGLQ